MISLENFNYDCNCWVVNMTINETLRSTVRLRIRKSISGHNCQTIEKYAKSYFQLNREVITLHSEKI